MTEFFYGVLFITLGLPLIEGIVSLYGRIINHICISISCKTKKKQEQLGSEGKQSTCAIGFQIPDEDYEYDEDDE